MNAQEIEYEDVAEALTSADGVLNTEAYEQARQLIEEDDIDETAVITFIDHWYNTDFSDFKQKFWNDYMGWFATVEDFAEDVYQALYDVPEDLARYIDWEQAGNDLLQWDFYENKGYYFRNH